MLIRSVALILQLNNHRRGLVLRRLNREGRGYGNSGLFKAGGEEQHYC